MAYWERGDPRSAHVIVCVHGLTRQGRDFDVLSNVLLERANGALRVLCPDVVGRGQSDWLRDPSGYQVPQYASDMTTLVQSVHQQQPIGTLDYVGTSMGGLIGIAVAGHAELPLPVPVRRLVLNDVGPALELAALQRIGSYVGRSGRFASLDEAASAMWAISSGFGPHSQAQWTELTRHMVVPAAARTQDGKAKRDATDKVAQLNASDAAQSPLVAHYDPAIAAPFRSITVEGVAQSEAAIWALYDAITAKTLVTRGAQSDLLSQATAHAMTERGPRARLVEFEGVGHAPTFVAAEQSDVVASFLLS